MNAIPVHTDSSQNLADAPFITAQTLSPLESSPEIQRQRQGPRPWSDHSIAWWLAGGDLLAIGGVVAYCLRHSHGAAWTGWWVAVAIPIVLYIVNGYRIDRAEPAWRAPLAALAVNMLVCASCFLLMERWSVMPHQVAIPAFVAAATWPAAWRGIVGAWVRIRAGRMRWLVVGSSACLRQVALDAQTAPTMGDLVLLPRRLNAHDPSDNVFHGTWDDLEAFLGQQWSGIVIATQKALPDHIIQRLMFARLSGARVLDLCDFYERQWRKLPVYHLHDGWFAITHGFSLLHHPARNQLKKLVDIGLALVIGTLAAPLMLAAAVAVKLSSSGPVLFRQERVGRFGRTFQLLKFRTMQLGSERGNRYTAICDPRVTTLGRLLRKTRIDELPQIWNVLRGDMSFIGPRAEWTKCVADYEQVIPFYHLRHLIRPGVTGWAQVNYPYGASIEDARQKLQFDLYYLKNHSLLLDARIVLKTVRTVLFGLGR